MISIPILLLSLAILLGMCLLAYVLLGKNTPKGLTVLHGSLSFLGLIALGVVLIYTPYRVGASLFILLIAALGGLYLLFKDLTDKIPTSVAIIHGIVALAGMALLLYSVYF